MASSYRFFNRNLRPIYAACPLPALRPPNDVTPVPPQILPEADYHRQELRRSLHCPWKHTRYKPPRPWIRPPGVPPLSRPFNAFNPTKPATKKKRGTWNAGLRLGDKVFECRRCTLAIDRQLAGARNNFLAAYGMAVGLHWDGITA